MAPERQSEIRLTGIHINLVDHIVTLEAQDGRKAQLSFGESTTLFEAQPQRRRELLTESDTPDAFEAEPEDEPWEPAPRLPVEAPRSDPESVSPFQEPREKQQTVVLNGRLRTQPKEGRPDGRGQPTAWARFAVHEDGAKDAHLYSATFHRHTAAIALGLAKGAQVTVEGYPHAGDPVQKRMDTFSVIAVHRYPGKPDRQPRQRRGEVKPT